VQRRLVSRDELLRIEPAFTPYAAQIAGGTFTATDESGDARLFTEKLAVSVRRPVCSSSTATTC
jgi:D-amino-acid dehydrogenase